jgi:hypothetical protein
MSFKETRKTRDTFGRRHLPNLYGATVQNTGMNKSQNPSHCLADCNTDDQGGRAGGGEMTGRSLIEK